VQVEQFPGICLCEICVAVCYSIFDLETLAEYPSLLFEGRVENIGLSRFGDESADKPRAAGPVSEMFSERDACR
jgi:hypothetical protein